MGRVWTARHRSPCGLCEQHIEEGDEAVFVDDEPCHLRCAEENGEGFDD